MKDAFQLMEPRQKPESRFRRVFAFLFFVLNFYPSVLILSVRASSVSGIKFRESLRVFNTGDYRSAMLGFMDVVIEEPDNDSARDYLQKSGRLVLELENGNIRLQRINLLQEAEAMKRRLVALEESKEAKIREWNRLFSRAKSLAGGVDSLQEAVSAHEEFMRETPVYAELKDEFSRKDKIIMGTFYETIKKRYPDMVLGRTGVDEADLGAVFFSGEALNDFPDRYLNTRWTEDIMAKSSRIKYLRGGVSALFDDEAHALELYSQGKFAQARALFRKVLKAHGANVEAVFYSALAAERVSLTGRLPPAAAAEPALPPSREPKSTSKVTALPGWGAFSEEPEQLPSKRISAQKRKKIGAAALPPKTVPPARAGEAVALADEFYEQGVREFSIGDYKAAAKSWDECLRRNPVHAKARLGLERLKSASGG